MFDESYAKECVKLEPTALESEFVRYTADFAFWGQKVAETKQQESLAKLSLEVLEADLDTMAREALAGDKKPTEAMIGAWVTKHPAHTEASKTLFSASYEHDRAKAVWDAMRAKRDMLVGLGAQQRAEMQHEPTVKALEF